MPECRDLNVPTSAGKVDGLSGEDLRCRGSPRAAGGQHRVMLRATDRSATGGRRRRRAVVAGKAQNAAGSARDLAREEVDKAVDVHQCTNAIFRSVMMQSNKGGTDADRL